MSGIFKYLREVRLELSKVIWPKKQEVTKLTMVVILVSAIIGAYIGAVDYGFTKILEYAVSR